MAKINNLNDFKNITSNITSFSHAYLFDVNSLHESLLYVKEFAKMIICGQEYEQEKYSDICYQIDQNEFDDLYIVNPDTIGINTEEINKLLTYMETKSLRENGRRVYIIYGFERLSRDVSNKVLKFLEEPNENIYGLLMTENMDRILTTIVSRCQVISLSFDLVNVDTNLQIEMKKFLECIYKKHYQTLAYENEFFGGIVGERAKYYDCFVIIEEILSQNIKYKYHHQYNEDVLLDDIENIKTECLINCLDITNNLKCLIKNNINLNLLIDRYIIEVTRELILCKK